MLLTLGRDDQLDPATEEWVSSAEERMIKGELTPEEEPVTEGKARTEEEAVTKTIEVAVKAATDREAVTKTIEVAIKAATECEPVTETIEVAIKAATERGPVTETIEIAVCKAMMGKATAGKGMTRKAGTKSATDVADANTKMASTKAAAKVTATAKVTPAAKSTSAVTHGQSACGYWRRAQRQGSSNCQNRFAHRTLSFCASGPKRRCAGRGQSISDKSVHSASVHSVTDCYSTKDAFRRREDRFITFGGVTAESATLPTSFVTLN